VILAELPLAHLTHLPSPATDMTSSRLQKLADVIDEAFLNGSFAEVCGPSYVVQDSRLTPEEAGACDRKACRHAAAGFEPATNSVIFYRPTWRQSPSLHRPLQADGVYCTDKLSWLAHTLGHEMVHAIVHHACPEARKHPAYQDDNGHGPIFLQLNKHIFGHDTARYKAGWGRLRPQLKVQPLQAIPALQQQESEQQEGWQSDGGSSPGWPSQQQQQQQQQWGEGQLQGPDQQLLSVADLLAGPPTLLQQQQRVERSSSGSCEQKLQSHSWQQHRASLQQQQQAHAGDASSSDASSTGSRESGDSSSSSSQTGISPYSSSKLAAIRSHMLQQRQQQELLHQQEYAALGSVGVDGLCGASGAARMRPRAWWSW